MKPIDPKTIIENLYSLFITWVAWAIPLAIYAIVAKDIPGSDLNYAFESGKLFKLQLFNILTLGTIHWFLNKMTDFPLIRRMSLIPIFAIRFLSFIIIMMLWDILDVITIMDESFGILPKRVSVNFIFSLDFAAPILFVLFMDTLYGWFYQIRTIIGKNIFRNLLLGKYRKPKTEKRIFMFIDMKDSTTHAEKLGHLKFTRLIQNCFRDFGVIADRRGVEIYQYVGDEVIVSWVIDKGLKEQNILRLFFDFRNQLQLNWEKYNRKFGVKPVFKGGAHMGDVTVAEIGLAKRGIEYLSDVLNTAARIQAMCNHYDADLLISGVLKEKLAESKEISMEFMENIMLKGKTNEVEIFKVSMG